MTIYIVRGTARKELMKKINLIILSLFIFFIAHKVSAVTYDVWTERKEDNDNLVYETKTLYKWYKEEKKGEYLLYDIVLDKYPYNDTTDTILSEYSKWENTCPKSEYRNIEYKDITKYKTIKNIKYMKIENISKNNKIEEIIIKSHNKNINYKVIDYSDNYIPSDNYFYTTAYAIFALEEECDANDLYLYLKTNEIYDFFSVYFYHDLEEDYIFSKHYTFTGIDNFIDKEWINENNQNLYTDIIEGENIIENDFTKIINTDRKCRYRDVLTYHYNIEKIYYDDEYHENVEGYLKDYATKKVLYKYEDIIGKGNTEYEYIKEINRITNTNPNTIKITSNNIDKLAPSNTEQKKNSYYIIVIIAIITIALYLIRKKCRTK